SLTGPSVHQHGASAARDEHRVALADVQHSHCQRRGVFGLAYPTRPVVERILGVQLGTARTASDHYCNREGQKQGRDPQSAHPAAALRCCADWRSTSATVGDGDVVGASPAAGCATMLITPVPSFGSRFRHRGVPVCASRQKSSPPQLANRSSPSSTSPTKSFVRKRIFSSFVRQSSAPV